MKKTVVYLTTTDRAHTMAASAMLDFDGTKKYYVSMADAHMNDLKVSENTYRDYLKEIQTGEYITTAEVYDRGGNLVKSIDYTNIVGVI